jgi:hypothetical protein
VLYDLTSTYFEGQAALNPKAKRGYSRDHRPDCKQVVVGLVINAEGFPLAHEIFEGNLQDRRSLKAMLDALNTRVPLQPGQTVVVDRDMAYDENLAEIRSRDLHYLVAARQPERNRWLAEFEGEGFAQVIRQPSPRNPFQKKPKVEVKLERRGDETYVLCRGAGRVEKDRAIRRKQEQRLLAVENTLLDKSMHTSWHTVRETLQTHQVCTVVLPTDAGAVLRIRKGSTPEPEHRTLYELLGVPLEVMRPRRNWVDPDQQCSD